MSNRVVEVEVILFTSSERVVITFQREDGREIEYESTAVRAGRIEKILSQYHDDDSYTAEMHWTFSSVFVMMWWAITRQEVMTLQPA